MDLSSKNQPCAKKTQIDAIRQNPQKKSIYTLDKSGMMCYNSNTNNKFKGNDEDGRNLIISESRWLLRTGMVFFQ